MNLRMLAGLAVILWSASGCASTDSAGAASGGSASTSSKSTDGDDVSGALPALTKGMTSDQVLKIAGKPTKVEARPAPVGKAEVWTYRRLVNSTTNQVATSVTSAPAYNPMPGGAPGEAPEAQYTLEHVKTYQITELLMFNDQLVAVTTHTEQKRYDDE